MSAGTVVFASTVSVDDHHTGLGHPERLGRLRAIERGLATAGLDERLRRIEGRPASVEELALVHPAGYQRALADLAEAGGGDLDPDTPVSLGSWWTACWAAGTGLAAIDALTRGEADAGFVAMRPPGHHASATQGMGFCLVNHVAVAAAVLAARGERVVILDWDVHHGNGTQAIFWEDDRVLYASLHQWPAYPGTGRSSETGGDAAPGLTVNVPLPPGATGDVALAAVDHVIAPVVDAFAPTWLLVSAGFDAHRDDPLADLRWSAGDYALLARRVLTMVPPGRVCAFLEGGYDLDALARSAVATIGAFAGVAEGDDREAPTAGGPGATAVREALAARHEVEGAV